MIWVLSRLGSSSTITSRFGCHQNLHTQGAKCDHTTEWFGGSKMFVHVQLGYMMPGRNHADLLVIEVATKQDTPNEEPLDDKNAVD